MNHDQIRELLQAYADGELDLVNALEVEEHLRSCEDCRSGAEQIRQLRETIMSDAPCFRAPAHLKRNIRAALRREENAEDKSISFWPVFAAALAVLILATVFFLSSRTSHESNIADEVIANHVRSLLATHLVDVASSDQHTVKPWFEGKIDFAPEVRDFAMSGFPLVGGRLDYLNGKTVAALIYQRNKHPINLFVMPAPSGRDVAPAPITRRGYNAFHWSRGQMEYWVVSDLNQTELREFSDLLFSKL
jgi:anti-sigma factor RsiW